jgi:pyruvate dehydrogenase E1 component
MFQPEEPAIQVQNAQDPDPVETREWLESLDAVVTSAGKERGRFLMKELEAHAQQLGVAPPVAPYSSYRNTISLHEQPVHPGDVALEDRITAIIRWNALAMVVRANKAYGELGGHIASYASAAEIFEIGFNHFFHGPQSDQGGILCTISRIPRPASMLAHFLRVG